MKYMLNLIICTLLGLNAFGQSPQENAVKKSNDVTKRQLPFGTQEDFFLSTGDVFKRILRVAKIPGGMIVLTPPCPEVTPCFQVNKLGKRTLGETLDYIVKVDPQYVWEEGNGVINLLPAQGEPAIMKVQISYFEMEAVDEEVIGKLLETPEMRQFFADHQITDSNFQKKLPLPSNQRKLNIRLENVTFREALNQIVQAHGRIYWKYTEIDCEGNRSYYLSVW